MVDSLDFFSNQLTTNEWIYKSKGAWNNKVLTFSTNGDVNINDQKVGIWGKKGIILYFQVQCQGIVQEYLAAWQYSENRVDWIKLNSLEEVYMLRVRE